MRTVFDIAQSRLQAVANTDRILARQREQKAELEVLQAQQQAILRNGTPDLRAAVLQYEQGLISGALKTANKSVVGAASLLGVSYQWLVHAINSKHPDLLNERSKIVKRKIS